MRASTAISDGYRRTCLADADRLATLIGSLQNTLGAAAAAAWTAKGSMQALVAHKSASKTPQPCA